MSYSPYNATKNWFTQLNAELVKRLETETSWKQWTKEWSLTSDYNFCPRNPFSTSNHTEGIVRFTGNNVFILAFWGALRGDSTGLWSTANQLQKAGYAIKKIAYENKQFVPVLYPQFRKDKETEESRLTGFRVYTVLSVNPNLIEETSEAELSVTELIEKYNPKPKPVKLDTKLNKVKSEIDNYYSISKVKSSYGDPAYSSSSDTIFMHHMEEFTSQQSYFATLLHEVGHSTGHEGRLNRNLGNKFGTPDYADEELIAELFALYMCNYYGIEYEVENHLSYIAHWKERVENQTGYFLKASSAAMKAFEYYKSMAQVKEIMPKSRKRKVPAGN